MILQYEFKAPWQMSLYIEIDSTSNYFQFIAIRSCKKNANNVNFVCYGKTHFYKLVDGSGGSVPGKTVLQKQLWGRFYINKILLIIRNLRSSFLLKHT